MIDLLADPSSSDTDPLFSAASRNGRLCCRPPLLPAPASAVFSCFSASLRTLIARPTDRHTPHPPFSGDERPGRSGAQRPDIHSLHFKEYTMNQQMFLTKTAKVLVALLLGCFLLTAGTAWCASGKKDPAHGSNKAAVVQVKEAKADKKLKPQAKAGKVQHTLAMLSNQELLALLQETRTDMPAYQHLTRMRPAANKAAAPVVGGQPPVPVDKAQVQQALETALTQPDQRRFIVSMLSNYMLNNSAY